MDKADKNILRLFLMCGVLLLLVLLIAGVLVLPGKIKSGGANSTLKATEKYLAPLSADKAIVVAVMPYELEGDMKVAAQRAEELLSEIELLSLVDRNRMEGILKEHKFQSSDWANQDTVAQVGQALNAQFVAYIDEKEVKKATTARKILSLGTTADHIAYVTLTLINVSTFRKFTFSVPSGEEFENETLVEYKGLDSKMLINMFNDSTIVPIDILDGTWYCDGVKESSVSYKADKLDYICPFASGYPLKSVKGDEKYAAFAEIEKADLNFGEMILSLSDGSELQNENGIIKEKKAKIFNTVRTNVKGDSTTYRTGIKPYSTCCIGKIRVRYNGDININGDVFYKDNQLAIQIGTSKDDGTGKAYFLMFSR